jgi:hypothetical protein
MQNKRGFWRNFTFKKWISISLIAFTVFIFFDIADALWVEKKEISSLLNIKWVLKRIFTPLFFGFWMTIWTEAPDKTKTNDSTQV